MWLVKNASIKTVDRHHIFEYLDFLKSPPKDWVANKRHARFETTDGMRQPNSLWRPFVENQSHGSSMKGDKSSLRKTSLSVLSSFFGYLVQENVLAKNPISLIRQKKQLLQSNQESHVHRKLSSLQWSVLINQIESLANQQPDYERHLFMLSCFFLLGLRISEMSATAQRTPMMEQFYSDQSGCWWFQTVGKGNKLRDIAVSDDLLLH